MADSYNELFGLGTHSEDAALEGWWKLQDDSADTVIADSSSNSKPGRLVPQNTEDATTTGPGGHLAKAISLRTGANTDHVIFDTLPAVTNLPNGTIVAKCKTSDPSPAANEDQCIFSISDASAAPLTRFQVGETTGSLSSESLSFISNQTPQVRFHNQQGHSHFKNGLWQALAVSIDGVDGENNFLYANGSTLSATYSLGSSTTANFSIGSGHDRVSIGSALWNSNGIRDLFQGELAGVAVFSRGLSNAELQQWDDGPEPLNTVDPTLSGTEEVGETLTSTTGTWDSQSNGDLTSGSYSYQWTRSDDGTGTGEADISGATASTYTLVSADSGKYIRCRVRASNDGGFDPAEDANTGFTGAIAAGGGTPSQDLIFAKISESETASGVTLTISQDLIFNKSNESESVGIFDLAISQNLTFAKLLETETVNSFNVTISQDLTFAKINESENVNSFVLTQDQDLIFTKVDEVETANNFNLGGAGDLLFAKTIESESASGFNVTTSQDLTFVKVNEVESVDSFNITTSQDLSFVKTLESESVNNFQLFSGSTLIFDKVLESEFSFTFVLTGDQDLTFAKLIENENTFDFVPNQGGSSELLFLQQLYTEPEVIKNGEFCL